MKQVTTFILCLSLYAVHATTWQVGPSKTYKNCYQVSTLVQNGDTVQIDFATYTNVTQVLWTKNNLYIVGVGGRPRLEAGTTIANDMVNGKGIFVISGSNVKVENIEFANAKVVDHNGAGIRQEGANLLVTRCRFVSDEMGILCGRILNCKITVEYSEFVNGGSTLNPGYQHNIYIGNIDTFVFRYNYSHEAIAEGHELKSRAAYNFILYNRIANEQTIDSRTIDLPNGGTSVIVGNIIEQGINSANTNLLGYGLEGLTNAAPHNLWICSNTFVNKKTSGSFVHIATGTDTLFLKNNILAGAKTGGLIIGTPMVMDSARNLITDNVGAVNFVNTSAYNYHLLANSAARDAGIAVTKTIKGYALQPTLVYKDTCNFEARKLIGTIDIGAFEYLTPSVIEAISSTTRLYPNPTSSLIFLEGEGFMGEHFYIYDVLGRLVKTGIVENKELNVSDLQAGLYFFKIKQQCYTVSKIN